MSFYGLTGRVRKLGAIPALVMACILATAIMYNGARQAAAAGCPPQTTDYGVVSNTVSIPAASTYRVWTHMFVPDTTNNTYLLAVNGTCFSVGGANVPAGRWLWVASHDGDAAQKNDVSLPAGAQAVTLTGNKPNVKVDRIVFAADLACTPSGDGTNCNTPADTTAPTVHLTAPASGSTVSGPVTLAATATDNLGVTHVEFYVNGSLVGADTTAPYTAAWTTAGTANGPQVIGAKAFDTANNVTQDNYTVTVQNGDVEAPSVPTGLVASARSYNSVNLVWKASTDNTGVAGYTVTRDGVPLANVPTGTVYTDVTAMANTTYAYQVLSFDAAGNKSSASAKATVTTPVVADSQAPTAPANVAAVAISANQINISWAASTDNTGVVAYDVYRATGTVAATKVASVQATSLADAGLSAQTTYTYYVKARDGNNNQSDASATVKATTQATPTGKHKRGKVTGTISNAATNAAVPYALVTIETGTSRHTYVATKRGTYKIGHLEPGVYRLTYRARNYSTAVAQVTIADDGAHVTKNINLQKQRER